MNNFESMNEEIFIKNILMKSYEYIVHNTVAEELGLKVVMILSRSSLSEESKNYSRVYYNTSIVLDKRVPDLKSMIFSSTKDFILTSGLGNLTVINVCPNKLGYKPRDFWGYQDNSLKYKNYLSYDGRSTTLRYLECTYNEFFIYDLDKKLLPLTGLNDSKLICIFSGQTFSFIKFALKMSGINLSSGGNNIKGILSPNQFILSIVLSVILKLPMSEITDSFVYTSINKMISRNFSNFKYEIDPHSYNKFLNIINPNEFYTNHMYKWGVNIEYSLINEENSQTLLEIYEMASNQLSELSVDLDLRVYLAKQLTKKHKIIENEISNIRKHRDMIRKNFIKQQNINKREYSTSRENIEKENREVLIENTFYPEYIKIINAILSNENLSLEEKQMEMENQLFDRIKMSVLDDQTFKRKYFFSEKSPNKRSVKELMNSALKTDSDHVKRKKIHKKYPYLWNDRLINIIIAYSTIIALYFRMGYTAIIYNVGLNIIENVFATLKESEYPELYKGKSRKEMTFNEFLENAEISKEEIISLGDYYFVLLSINDHAIFQRKYNRNTGEMSKIEIDPQFISFLQKSIIINPVNLPMVAKPKTWSLNSYGGYYRNEIIKKGVVTKSNLDNNHIIEINDFMLRGVNILNETEFEVNTLMLNYLNSDGRYLLEHDNLNDDNSTKLAKQITLSICECYKNNKFYLTVNCDWRGRVVTQSFYITYQGSDFNSSLINFYKGEKLDQTGKIFLYIHGANNHNENQISKDTFTNRVEWVKNNYKKIIAVDRDLILSAENKYTFAAFCLVMREIDRNPEYIVKMPVLLDATCSGIQHFAGLLRDYELAYNVNLLESDSIIKPHDVYSILLKTINENIHKFGEENDRYSSFKQILLDRGLVKHPIMTKVYNVTNHGISDQLRSKFEKFNIFDCENLKNKFIFSDYMLKEIEKSIKDCKELVKNYDGHIKLKNIEDYDKVKSNEDDATVFIYNIIKSKLNKKEKVNLNRYIMPGKTKDVVVSDHDIMKIAQIIDKTTFTVFPLLDEVYKFFINCVKVVNHFKVPVMWFTPSGTKISQEYLKVKNRKISTSALGVNKTIVLNEHTGKIDKKDQSLAIIPNIIHSLDATHLLGVVARFKEYSDNIITIHDCFGTHPNKMWKFSEIVKEEFIFLYTRENFLDMFLKRNVDYLKELGVKVRKSKGRFEVLLPSGEDFIKFPKVPNTGDLDLNKIKKSTYMIS